MKDRQDIESLLDEFGAQQTGKHDLSYVKLLERIEEVKREQAPRSLIVTATIVLLLTLGFNVFLVRNSWHKKAEDSNLVRDMGLMSNPSIYGSL